MRNIVKPDTAQTIQLQYTIHKYMVIKTERLSFVNSAITINNQRVIAESQYAYIGIICIYRPHGTRSVCDGVVVPFTHTHHPTRLLPLTRDRTSCLLYFLSFFWFHASHLTKASMFLSEPGPSGRLQRHQLEGDDEIPGNINMNLKELCERAG